MKPYLRIGVIVGLMACLVLACFGQQAKKSGILESADLKAVVPTNYFFDGQVAPVQFRNSVAIRTGGGHLVVAGLVDNSGYSSDVAQKYQGFFITEQKLNIEGKTLSPGQYGFGFAGGNFRVMDVGGNDVLLIPHHQDDNLKRPVPLKAVEEGGNYRLYAGKKYVTLKAQ